MAAYYYLAFSGHCQDVLLRMETPCLSSRNPAGHQPRLPKFGPLDSWLCDRRMFRLTMAILVLYYWPEAPADLLLHNCSVLGTSLEASVPVLLGLQETRANKSPNIPELLRHIERT